MKRKEIILADNQKDFQIKYPYWNFSCAGNKTAGAQPVSNFLRESWLEYNR